jgi:hypothetical protein
LLEARSLTKYYNHTPAVSQVSFTIRAGEILGYLGPNGAGKSTTMEWEKLPFTCSYLPGKSPAMMLLFLIAGFMGFLPIVNLIVVNAVYNTMAYAIVLGLLAASWVWAHHTRKMVWGQLRLTYDDTPEPDVRSLNLRMN